MWWTVVIALLVMKSNGQLTSPSEATCPGNRIIFTCQQIGLFSVWTINLRSSVELHNIVRSSQVGSIVTFANDPGYNFEIHIVSNSSNIITTELQVTAIRDLDGITVICGDGATVSEDIMSTIQVASIATPSGVMTTYNQFTTTGASVNVTWSASTGTDNYTITVTPPVTSGQSDFITTATSLQLIIMYNINYSINIAAQNCAGNNSTVVPVIVAGCHPPPPLSNGRINEYLSGSVGAVLTFQCSLGYIPHEQATSSCQGNGSWIPIPQCMLADCGTPNVASGVVIEPFNSTQYDATIILHCDEDLIPQTIVKAVCGSTGVWNPNPAFHLCVDQSTVFCSAPLVPNNAHINNQSWTNTIYLEGTNVTFQCRNNGSQTLLTSTCYSGDWSPPPAELVCEPLSSDITNVLSNSSQVIIAAVVCSFVFFLIGLLVGALCHYLATVFAKSWNRKHPNGVVTTSTPTDTPAEPSVVVYEEVASNSPSGREIELKENVAYGPI